MPEDYIVQRGDCISSIAYEKGFFWETIWNDGSNADLKSKRKDPNVLMEGDVVHVPDLTVKQESGATEKRHKFKLKGVPVNLKIKVRRIKADQNPSSASPGGGDGISPTADPDYQPPKNQEEAVANADYVLEVDGVVIQQGKTDQDGIIEATIVPDARAGKLTFDKGTPTETTVMLDLGAMDPVEEITGVRKRLCNLGFYCEEDGAEDTPDLVAALKKFQERNSLDITGKVDDATQSKLKEIHGS